jgi:FlaA1/EpsC-like NDP-sugar epimerase
VRWAALAVGISWIPLWYMSYRATREYQPPFDIKFFFRNIIGAGLAYFILLLLSWYLILSPVPLFLIAIFWYLSIFLLINKRMLKDFIAMIRASKMPPTDTNNTPLSSL